jgi:hypothetical protein
MPEASAAKHALCRGREVRQALGALYPATLRLVGVVPGIVWLALKQGRINSSRF